MVAYAKEHFLNDGDTKPVYIICRSGKVGAPRAAGNLLEAEVDPSRIFIVEGGASALKNLTTHLLPTGHLMILTGNI
ncbi:MAG: hypothetical protein V8S08_02770 [Lachnoclostridium sp.]